MNVTVSFQFDSVAEAAGMMARWSHAAPGTIPAPAAPVVAEKATNVAPAPTAADVSTALRKFASAHGPIKATELLSAAGVTKASEIAEDQRAAFIAACEAM